MLGQGGGLGTRPWPRSACRAAEGQERDAAGPLWNVQSGLPARPGLRPPSTQEGRNCAAYIGPRLSLEMLPGRSARRVGAPTEESPRSSRQHVACGVEPVSRPGVSSAFQGWDGHQERRTCP